MTGAAAPAIMPERRDIVAFPGLAIVGDGKTAKLTKDGRVKKTHSNAATGRSTWVDPIRDIKDVFRVLGYLQEKVDEQTRMDYAVARARNKMYFAVGVLSGFRASDLLEIRWSDIFESDGKTYRDRAGIIEKKTGKVKQLYSTEASREYIEEYIELAHPDTCSDEHIFMGRNGKVVCRQVIDDFIKEAAKACGLRGNYSTHSVRKTYAYQYYKIMAENGDQFALAEVQKMLNHRNTETTLRYLGIDKEQQKTGMDNFAKAMLEARKSYS